MEEITKTNRKDKTMNLFQQEEIIHLFNTKEIDADWSFGDYKPSDTGKWTHNYHRYPAKFIPQLVERLIDEYIPLELPYRLIQLYTFEGEIVLDPFMGSGQTAIASVKSQRHYIGYDINEEYVKLAERRIKDFLLKEVDEN